MFGAPPRTAGGAARCDEAEGLDQEATPEGSLEMSVGIAKTRHGFMVTATMRSL